MGTGTATSFNELAALLGEVLGRSVKPEYFKNPYPPASYQSFTQADLTLAQEKLGYQPEWDLRSGIRDYFQGLNIALH